MELKRNGTALALVAISLIVYLLLNNPGADVLKGMDKREYSNLELQLIGAGFCLSPLIGKLEEMPQDENKEIGNNTTFVETGDVPEDEYSQSSIYALLYSMYKNEAKLTHQGQPYQFTFNTWGIAPSPYPQSDPERHGKAAYAALASQAPVFEYIKKNNIEKPEFVEVGCGTGAGASLITTDVHPNAHYLALDMQPAAINTCKERHAKAGTLTCQLVPEGVGNNGSRIPKEDSSVDFVVISETHIAERQIGQLEKDIFAEVRRVLKPGGMLLWGNALTTSVWNDAKRYLEGQQWTLKSSTNHTAGACTARDEDFERVELLLEQMISGFHVMGLPYFGERCKRVTKKLIANFYRHPGTNMYLKMVVGEDSYMHQAWAPQK